MANGVALRPGRWWVLGHFLLDRVTESDVILAVLESFAIGF